MKKIIVSAIVAMVLLISAVSCTYSLEEKTKDEHPQISAEELISLAEQSDGYF